MQGIERVAGTVADQAQPVAQRTAKFLKEQAPVVAENAEPTAARASEIAEGLAHEVRWASLRLHSLRASGQALGSDAW